MEGGAYIKQRISENHNEVYVELCALIRSYYENADVQGMCKEIEERLNRCTLTEPELENLCSMILGSFQELGDYDESNVKNKQSITLLIEYINRRKNAFSYRDDM